MKLNHLAAFSVLMHSSFLQICLRAYYSRLKPDILKSFRSG